MKQAVPLVVSLLVAITSAHAQQKQTRTEPIVRITENRGVDESEHHRTPGLDPDGKVLRVKIIGSAGRGNSIGGVFSHLTNQMGLEGWSLAGGSGPYTTGTALKWSGHTEQVAIAEGHYDALILSPYRIHGNADMVARERIAMADCFRLALYGKPDIPTFMLHNMRIEYSARKKTFQRRQMHNWYTADAEEQIPKNLAHALQLAEAEFQNTRTLAIQLADDLTARLGSVDQQVRILPAAAAELEVLRQAVAGKLPGLNTLEDLYVTPCVKLGEWAKVPVSDYLFALVVHSAVSGQPPVDLLNASDVPKGQLLKVTGEAAASDRLLQEIAWKAIQGEDYISPAAYARADAALLKPTLSSAFVTDAKLVRAVSQETLSGVAAEFADSVDAGLALNTGIYKITPATKILAVVPGRNDRSVYLRTSPVKAGVEYTLAVQGAGEVTFTPTLLQWQLADRDRATKASWAFFGDANGLLGYNAKGYGTLSRKQLKDAPFESEGNEFIAHTVPRTGDFDFHIRIHALSKNGVLGIVTANDMADLSRGGYCYVALTNPRRNTQDQSAAFEVGYVDAHKTGAVSDEINTRIRSDHPGGPRPVPLWRTWLRLVRKGDSLSAYTYTDDKYDDYFHGARVQDSDWKLLHTFKTMGTRETLRVGVFTTGGSPNFASETFSTCEIASDAFREVSEKPETREIEGNSR